MKTCLTAAAVLLSLALPALAGREDVLRRAVQGCDRVRVRSGGTCHRDEAGEKTLAEVTELTDLLALLRGIGIDAPAPTPKVRMEVTVLRGAGMMDVFPGDRRG